MLLVLIEATEKTVPFVFLGCFRNSDSEECGTSEKNLHMLMEKSN